MTFGIQDPFAEVQEVGCQLLTCTRYCRFAFQTVSTDVDKCETCTSLVFFRATICFTISIMVKVVRCSVVPAGDGHKSAEFTTKVMQVSDLDCKSTARVWQQWCYGACA